jgi:hypothetical protein
MTSSSAADDEAKTFKEGWTMRLPPPPPGNPPAVRFDDLPTVLRRLGLELKQQEATVLVYTVEHIERPPAG